MALYLVLYLGILHVQKYVGSGNEIKYLDIVQEVGVIAISLAKNLPKRYIAAIDIQKSHWNGKTECKAKIMISSSFIEAIYWLNWFKEKFDCNCI